MQIDPRSKTRILEQFRAAIDHQIQVWDQTQSLAEDLCLESDDVLSEVQAHSTTADITLQNYAYVIGDAQRRAVDSLAGRVLELTR
jgi:hypothetical protein